MLAGLVVASLVPQRAAERVVRVVVGGRELEHLAELLFGLRPARDPEVGDPERLADRCLLRLEPLRLLERDGRLRRHAVAKVASDPAGRGRTRRSCTHRADGVKGASAATALRGPARPALAAPGGGERATELASRLDGGRARTVGRPEARHGQRVDERARQGSRARAASPARGPSSRRVRVDGGAAVAQRRDELRARPRCASACGSVRRSRVLRRARFAPTIRGPEDERSHREHREPPRRTVLGCGDGGVSGAAAPPCVGGCGVKSRKRPVPSAATASAESEASV